MKKWESGYYSNKTNFKAHNILMKAGSVGQPTPTVMYDVISLYVHITSPNYRHLWNSRNSDTVAAVAQMGLSWTHSPPDALLFSFQMLTPVGG